MTEAALTPAQAKALAKGITGSRLAVAAVYDEIAARIGGDLPDFKTVALGLHEVRAAFEAALLATGANPVPWHRLFLAELAAQGLIDLPEQTEEAATSVSILPENADGSAIDLAKFSAMMSPALRTADLMYAFNLAARRLCLITIQDGATKSQGTGFLVGPQTVLTNHHVVADLIDPVTGKAREGSAGKISCKFETLTDTTGRSHPVVEDWLIDFSPVDPNPAQPGAVAPATKHLDYCAIRLQGAPGRERGWYDLSATGSLDAATDAFFVFQHPHGVPQRAAFATDTRLDADPDFLRHNVWTSPGSSGGLCLDNRFRPIAMHQGSQSDGGTAGPAPNRKRAIRLAAIREVAKDIARPDPKHDRITALSDGSAAVIGRDATQSTLRIMAEGRGTYILVIRGGRQSGKSFSTLLLRDSIPGDQRIIISFGAADLPADARDLARMILSQAGMAEADITGALASQARMTTSAASVADVFAILKRSLLDIAAAGTTQGKLLWLLIDDLDKVNLPQIGSRALLDHIYSDSELAAVMRIVLIGLSDVLLNVSASTIATEVLPAPDKVEPRDIEDCLGRLLTQSGKASSAGEAGLQARIIAGAAEELRKWNPDRSPLSLLSGFVAGVYMKAIR
jgi:hypothetical protein